MPVLTYAVSVVSLTASVNWVKLNCRFCMGYLSLTRSVSLPVVSENVSISYVAKN